MSIYRATIRISLNNDQSSYLRNSIKNKAFSNPQFTNKRGARGTGTWVRYPCTIAEMSTAMTNMWSVLGKYSGKAEVDHIWSNMEPIDLGEMASDKNIHVLEGELSQFGVAIVKEDA